MKLAAIFVLSSFGLASANAMGASCPMPSDAAATLKYVSFFDGDPAEMVELAPDDASGSGKLDLTWQFTGNRSRPVTLVCSYSNSDTQRVEVDQGVSLCKLTGDVDGGGNVLGTPVLVCQ